MSRTFTDLECKEPWLYWWLLLGFAERKRICTKHFPVQLQPLTRQQKQIMWEAENKKPLTDEQWVELGEQCVKDSYWPPPISRKEIWRQVYRIASQHINSAT